MVNRVISKLKQIKGLANFYILTEEDRKKILELEEERNLGVRECLKKRFVLAMSHDSSFREPPCAIVKDDTFPPVPFQEIKGAISSSPGWKVHEFLKTKFSRNQRLRQSQKAKLSKINLKNGDATLIVGFE